MLVANVVVVVAGDKLWLVDLALDAVGARGHDDRRTDGENYSTSSSGSSYEIDFGSQVTLSLKMPPIL